MKTRLNNKDVALVFECPRCDTVYRKSVKAFQIAGFPVCPCGGRADFAHVEVETKLEDGATAKSVAESDPGLGASRLQRE